VVLAFPSVSTTDGQPAAPTVNPNLTQADSQFSLASGATLTVPPSTAEYPTYFDLSAPNLARDASGQFINDSGTPIEVKLSFAFDPALFPVGTDPVILHNVNGSWIALTSTVDRTTNQVFAYTSSFSPFAIAVKPTDITPPVISAPANVSAAATTTSGATVNFTATATDDFDGPVSVSYSQNPGTVFPPGTTTVPVTARDSSGNTASKSIQVAVTYAWSGVLQPVNADGSSVFKLGSTVPVKFQLTGASAGITNLPAKLYIAQQDSVDPVAVNEAVSTAAADSGNTFRYTGGQYLFNLSTKGLSKGTWYMRIDLGDGTNNIVAFKLK
jgi:hypothetical protein